MKRLFEWLVQSDEKSDTLAGRATFFVRIRFIIGYFMFLIFLFTVSHQLHSDSLLVKSAYVGDIKVEIVDGKQIYALIPQESVNLMIQSKKLRDTAICNAGANQKGLCRIAYQNLSATLKCKVLNVLFPEDRMEGGYWYHRVKYTGRVHGGENLFRISMWFTGSGRNVNTLKSVNQLHGDMVRVGDIIKIPTSLLSHEIKKSCGQNNPEKSRLTTPVQSDDNRSSMRKNSIENLGTTDSTVKYGLKYGKDTHGSYALYTLKRGEALYSSVIVRFTGRVTAKEVNRLARKVATRSGIKDITDIPAGYPIKIPLDLLTPEYLPPKSTLRTSYFKNRAISLHTRRKVVAKQLENVLVIIDAGHGGLDPGAKGVCGLTEDEYVYDVSCRLRRAILSKTKAKVLFTNYDRISKYAVLNKKYLAPDTSEWLLTHPRYKNRAAKISAHLRWYLSNYYFKKWLRNGGSKTKVVFLSIHADALHPSVSGLMVYFPAAELGVKQFSKSGRTYSKYQEVRADPSVHFTGYDRYFSEAQSRKLATLLIENAQPERIPVHQEKPIRSRVYRGEGAWIPAVIRYNLVPTKILIELSNLKNRDDCTNLKSAKFRERVAEMITRTLLAYYSPSG